MAYISFSWMRRIDSWVGRPIAVVLGWSTRSPRSLYGDKELDAFPNRVLCSQFIGLGNVILALPLLRALKEKGVRLAFWSFEGQAEIVRLSGLADEILIVRPTLSAFLPSLWRSWRAARKFRADLFIDLEPTARFSAILARLSGVRIRFGFLSGRSCREPLFTHLVSLSSERHRVENNNLMLRRLGLSGAVNAVLPAVPDLSGVRNVMPDLPSRKRILININSGDLSQARMWPEDHWVDLCNRLLEDLRVDLIFPGSMDDRDRVQTLIARLKDPMRVFNVAGTVTLVELLRLLHDSELVISVESGIMHLAAWVNVSLIALFGPETPNLHSPLSKNARVLWAGLPCSPCVNISSSAPVRCGDHQCMSRLTPQWVHQTCLSLSQSKMDHNRPPEKPQVA